MEKNYANASCYAHYTQRRNDPGHPGRNPGTSIARDAQIQRELVVHSIEHAKLTGTATAPDDGCGLSFLRA